MTDDLAAPVLAAIAKEERFAHNALGLVGIENPWWTWQALKARFPDLSRADCVHISRHGARDSLRRCAADRRIVERHSPTWPDGKPEYGYHWEHTASGQMVEVRNVEPDPPYYCETCQCPSPCPDLQDMAEGYGIEVK